MAGQNLKTEEIILRAAKKVFTRKGYDGTTMQKIADEAGINKALLHYYYRTKDKLFLKVFRIVFQLFVPKMGKIFSSEMTLFEKIEAFADTYIQILINNPYIPVFVMKEITSNPKRLSNAVKYLGVDPEQLFQPIRDEIKKGNIEPIDPRQLFVNLIGLCIFPIAAKPMVMAILFNNNEEEYLKFLQERKKEVPRFIINSIRKK
ncbi:MAG: TetR/AcrR family transcriptional regulator [Bacteroidetes bacterium]|nr:TetR/AcrR family transcriptional regulator [Bacteroidota bacterium]